jgi:hypothetical protein
MADVQVQQLPALGGNALAADDVLLAVDVSAAEARKITVNDLISAGSALIPNATIPSAKVNFAAGSILAASLAADAVTTEKLLADAVTGAKLADNSTCVVAANLAALQAVTGLFVGQLGLTTDNLKLYLWQGSAWQLIKAAGSINAITAGTDGIVNITSSISGDTATISTTLDETAAAAQFLAGPTGAAGAVAYRTIVGTDLPTATTTTKGGVIINGGGLTMSGDTAIINNTVTPVTDLLQKITYNAQGLITASSAVGGTDLPAATSIARGAAQPGTGLSVDVNGVFNHTNVVTGTTQNGITFDNQGHITNAVALVAGDIPNLDASKITTGTLNSNLIGTNALAGTKLANFSTVKFGGAGSTSGVVTFPTPDFTGQQFFDSSNGDLYLFDGNTWQPITVISGDLVYAGTYDASTNRVKSVTTQGSAAGLVVGAVLPAASATNVRYYVVVSDSGNGVSPAPAVALAPPDMIVSNGATWDLVDVSNAIAGQIASNISFTPYGNLAANNVQTALQELDDEKLSVAGGLITGELRIGTAGALAFEGSTDNAYETYIAVTDPLTADRTITLPDASGTVLLSGTVVNADISATAEIAVSKLADGNARQLLQTSANGNDVEWTDNVDIPGTLDVTGAAVFDTGITSAGDVTLNARSDLRFADADSSNWVAFQGAATIAANVTWTLPSADGTSGQMLSTDGSGTLSWASAGNVFLASANAFTGANTFTNSTGQIFRQAATQDGILLRGRAGGTSSFTAEVVPTTLTASRTATLPDASITVAGTNLAQSYTAAQRGAISALTDGATITPDFAVANNFSVTLGGNRTLANPTNLTAGQSGCIWITQDGTGSRTLAYGTQWDFTGGTAPTLTTTANARDCLVYAVQSTTQITATLITNLS